MADQMPDGWRDKVMHAQLRVGDRVLMGADMPPDWFKQPQGFSVSLNLGDVEAAKRIFARLAEGGTVGMEFQETFWAKGFGMLTDRFGIPWMLNIQPQAAQSV
jgi:PhnB protein